MTDDGACGIQHQVLIIPQVWQTSFSSIASHSKASIKGYQWYQSLRNQKKTFQTHLILLPVLHHAKGFTCFVFTDLIFDLFDQPPRWVFSSKHHPMAVKAGKLGFHKNTTTNLPQMKAMWKTNHFFESFQKNVTKEFSRLWSRAVKLPLNWKNYCLKGVDLEKSTKCVPIETATTSKYCAWNKGVLHQQLGTSSHRCWWFQCLRPSSPMDPNGTSARMVFTRKFG